MITFMFYCIRGVAFIISSFVKIIMVITLIVRNIKQTSTVLLRMIVLKLEAIYRKKGRKAKNHSARVSSLNIWVERLRKNNYIDIFYICLDVYLRQLNCLEIYKVDSFKCFCEKHGQRYEIIEQQRMRIVCKPEYYKLKEKECEEHLSPEIYYCEIKQAEIIGETSLVLVNKNCLYDALVYDTDKRYDLVFSSLRKIISNYIIIETQRNIKSIECAIFLLGFASYNYYHLTVEILSRLAYIDSFPEYQEWPILIDRIAFNVPQYKALVESVNTRKHPIIIIEPKEKVLVKRLVYISYNTWMPINVKSREMIRTNDFMIAESGLINIRTKVLHTKEKILPFRKLFISRKNTKTLRLKNEMEVRKLFVEAGFEVIYTEEMSLEEQVRYFSEARCVVGTSGGALTNIVYCQRDTLLICIIPMEFEFYMYSTIAEILHLKTIFLNADVIERTAYTAMDVFELNISYCKDFIDNIIKMI